MKSTVFLLALVALAALVAAAPTNDYEQIINNLPEEDRVVFLRYHIRRGYELTENIPGDDLPADFSIKLYQYAKEKHNISDEELLKQLREIVCFEDGSCIDIGDIGVHPKK